MSPSSFTHKSNLSEKKARILKARETAKKWSNEKVLNSKKIKKQDITISREAADDNECKALLLTTNTSSNSRKRKRVHTNTNAVDNNKSSNNNLHIKEFSKEMMTNNATGIIKKKKNTKSRDLLRKGRKKAMMWASSLSQSGEKEDQGYGNGKQQANRKENIIAYTSAPLAVAYDYPSHDSDSDTAKANKKNHDSNSIQTARERASQWAISLMKKKK